MFTFFLKKILSTIDFAVFIVLFLPQNIYNNLIINICVVKIPINIKV